VQRAYPGFCQSTVRQFEIANINSNRAHSPLITVARSGTIWTRQFFSWIY